MAEFLVIGKTIKKIEAGSAQEALRLNPDALSVVPYKKVNKKLTPLDIALVASDLEVMLTSGLSLTEALEGIISSKSGYVANVFYEVRSDILTGSTFSSALAKRPEIPKLFADSVRAGEESGRLPQVLKTLASYYRTTADVHSKIGLALIMPIATIIATAAVFLFMLHSLFPQLRSFAKDAGVTISSPITNFFFKLSDNIIVVAIVVVILLALFIKNKDKVMRKLPIIGNTYSLLDLHMDMFLLASVMNLTLTAGIRIPQALDYIIPSIRVPKLKKALEKAKEKINRATSITDAFFVPEIPGMLRNVIIVGERSGKLAEMFESLANSMAANVDYDTKMVENSMPVAMTLILGIVVFSLLGTFYFTYFSIIAKIMGGLK
jgi:type IV pilus assembly protein PilC